MWQNQYIKFYKPELLCECQDACCANDAWEYTHHNCSVTQNGEYFTDNKYGSAKQSCSVLIQMHTARQNHIVLQIGTAHEQEVTISKLELLGEYPNAYSTTNIV